MVLKADSKQTKIKVGRHKGEYMYVMKINHYNVINADKIIQYASDSSGIPKGVMRASWEALDEIITSWVMEGHIVEIPGLGNIRAEVRSKAQSNAEDVTTADIFRRKLILSPCKEIKNALNSAPVSITCYDKDGKEVRKMECLTE